jgi:hypothetical protein
MLERDFKDYFPKLLVENIDPSGQALIDYINTTIPLWKNEIIEMHYLKVPYRMPAKFIDGVGEYLEADLLPIDTERQKRQKLTTAVQRHKNRGLWEDDIKIIIDNITGKDSSLVDDIILADAILYGDGSEDETLYYMTLGGDGIDDELGIDLSGDIENNIPGIVYIDLGYTEEEILYIPDDDSIIPGDGTVAGTTYYSSIGVDGIDGDLGTFINGGDDLINDSINTIINLLEISLEKSLPAYYRVFVGYINNDGNFVILAEV